MSVMALKMPYLPVTIHASPKACSAAPAVLFCTLKNFAAGRLLGGKVMQYLSFTD